MRAIVLAVAPLLVLAGCTGPTATVYLARPSSTVANLVLGPSAEHTWLAGEYASRSSWPSVQTGYVFEDFSAYSELIFDDQSFYDRRDGGSYTRQAVSVRSGVVMR